MNQSTSFSTGSPTSSSKPTKQRANQSPLYTTDAVRSYLHEISRISLLIPEQETSLGRQVQRLMALLEYQTCLSKTLGRLPSKAEWATVTELTEAALEQQILEGQRAKRKMIEANLRFVVAIAKKYQGRNLDLLDLIQEGTLGLERAVEKFDPTKGYKFSTYAYWWIRQGITRAIAQQSRTIRLPIHVTEQLNQIKRIQRELSQKLGRKPSLLEVSQELNLEPEKMHEYLLMSTKPVSLDICVGDNQDTELQELLEDNSISPEDFIIYQALRQDIQAMLSELPLQQQEIIRLRFGLNDGVQLSLVKVGARMGISRERVRQLEHQALKSLRRKKAKIKGYLVAS